VRQTALFSLPFTPRTLPVIILRTRDVDPNVRRTVYLQALSLAQIQDPRRLTIRQREEVVRNGLGDRDPKVRQAAGTMLTSWVEAAGDGGLIEVRLWRLSICST
jgi:condensin complex subunit 3